MRSQLSKRVVALLLTLAMILTLLPTVFADAPTFTDVEEGKYYYEAVQWAVEKGITTGTSATTFGPDRPCTRGQVVTFLWRTFGEPEPTTTEHPFTDVEEGKYYYKAMLWAVEKEITAGTSKTAFSPDKICTRGQIVTFLWRAADKPEAASEQHPFTDVKDGAYYFDAMLWAVENKITSGVTATTFKPDNNCTRGQVVTFLHRAFKDFQPEDPNKPDKDELEDAIDDAEELDESAYTPASFAAFQAALAAAQAVLNDPNATQDEVDEALAALEEAIAALQPASTDFVLAVPKDGDEIVLYNAGNGMAVTAEMSGYYVQGTAVTPTEDHKIVEPAENIIWTVTMNEDGTMTLRNGEKVLAAGQTPKDGGGYYNNLYLEEGTNSIKWTAAVCNEANYSYTLTAAGLESQYGAIYLEWYGNKSAFSAYDTSADRATEPNFGFQAYVKGAEYVEPGPGPGPGPGPSEGEFVLAEPENGDEVVIYNAGHGLAIKNETDNDWYLLGSEVTVDEEAHKITNPAADIVWTVATDGNGMYRFTNGSNAITCYVSGTYLELTNKADYEGGVTDWALKEAEGAPYAYYIKNWSLSGQYGPGWLEFYTKNNTTKLSCYGTSEDRLTLADFGFQFYVKGAEYVEPGPGPQPPVGEDKVFVKVTEPLEDWSGTYVIARAKNETTAYVFDGTNDKNENFVEAPLAGDQITASTDNAIVVEKSGTGYTFLGKGGYLNGKDAANGLVFANEPAVGNIAFADGLPTITSATGTVFRFNNKTYTDSSYLWFRFFKPDSSVTTDANTYVELYKLDDGIEPPPPAPDYVLFGWINGANYACEEDFENPGEYKFVDGKLTATFEQNSYVAVKLSDNSAWYMTDGWLGEEATSATLYNTTKEGLNADKLFVPGGVEVEFTLTVNGDDTLTLSYEKVIPPEQDEYALTGELHTGDEVVIYSPAADKAVDSTLLASYYLTPTAVEKQGDVIVDPAATAVWTVTVNGNGTYTFDQFETGLTLVAYASGTYVDLGNTTGDGRDPEWVIETKDADANTFTIKSSTIKKGEMPVYLEWYAAKTEFSAYGSNNPSGDAFAFQFYSKVGGPGPGQDLQGKTVILHTNDTHGALMGFAQVAAVEAEMKARGADVILVDAGDYSQGTPYVSTTKGAAAIAAMNAAGYDFATLGNHEFDFGYAQLKANLENAEFRVLCADVFVKETGEPAFYSYAVEDANGVKIGFFGMETPETLTKVNPALITELSFPQGEALYDVAGGVVDALRNNEGVDLVIGLVHLGVDGESEPNRSIDLYNHVDGIDFLIDGHSHTVMTEGPNSEPIQSTGTKASKTAFMNVGVIVIDNESKAIESNYLIELGDEAPVDETVAAAIREITDPIDAEYSQVFATSEVELNGDKAPGNRTQETNMGDLIADALKWSVMKDMDAETLGVPEENVVAVTNGGGIREWIHAGDVSMSDVNTVLPFGNTVAVVYVTGAELLEALEASTYCTPDKIGGFPQISGMKININTSKEFDEGDLYPDSTYHAPASIQRVTIEEVNGQAFDPAAKYAVVTNNFCADGGDTYYVFKNASAQFDTGIPMDEALISYITEELEGVIGQTYAEPQGRITILEDLHGKTVILHTNDTHGALLGFAQVAAVEAQLKAQGAEVILVDAGDYSQGTPYVSSTKGAAAIAAMNAAGYDFATLGNHEFDFGYAQLKTNLENAEFRVLCADVFVKESGEPAFYSYAVEDANGVKIGFFGMETPETLTKVNPALITELSFPQGEEMYEVARGVVKALRENEGVDLVIGLVHLGVDGESEPNRSVDLFNNVEGIDFLIDGHSHTVMEAGPNGEPIQSTGTKASKTALMNVGAMVIDNETKAIEKNYLIALGDEAPVDETVAAAIREITDPIDAEYSQVFATSGVELNGDKAPGNRTEETNMGDLIADALKWSVMKDMDADTLGVPEENVIAITNGGGIREWIHVGDVTKSDVNTVLPFGNTVAVVYVTGAELLEALEASTYCTPDKIGGFPQVSGMKINIDITKEFNEGDLYPDSTYHAPASIRRVTIDEINGQPFDPAAKYAVVTNNFCAEGGDTYYVFKNASAQFDTGIPMDEALIDFITNELNGVIDEPYDAPQGRITMEERESVNAHKYEIVQASNNSARFGHLDMNVSVADFLEIFALGDIVTVTVGDYSFDAPVVTNYDDVLTFEHLLRCANGKQVVTLAINYSQIGVAAGLLTPVEGGYAFVEGIEWPLYATVELKEAGGYAEELAVRAMTRTNDRADYASDEEFANFRAVTTTGMGENILYRSSSPVSDEIGRNAYADALAEAAGIKTFINLADNADDVLAGTGHFTGYEGSYYATQSVKYLGLPVAFTSAEFKAGLAEGYRYIITNEAPYMIHCLEGKDRTGLSIAVLEALMGASLEEIQADYLKTYENYFDMVEGVHVPLTDAQKEVVTNIITVNLGIIFDADLETANLADEAAAYLLEIGLAEDEITTLKADLAGRAAPDYVLFGWINGANYACEEDFENPGEYKFVDGKLTATFEQNSYVAVKLSDNSAWYMTDGWLGEEATSATLYNTTKEGLTADKLFVPGGVEVEFTLVDNGDDTLTLSYAPTANEPEYVYYHGMSVADGDEVVIYHPDSGKAISNADSTVASNPERYRLGVDTTVENGIIAEPADGTVWTVEVDAEKGIAFVDADGKYLSVPTSYANLVLDSDCKYWTVTEAATEGAVFLISTESKGSSGDFRGIEYYQEKFTTYYANETNLTNQQAAFALELYVKTDKSTIHEHDWVAGTVDAADCTHQEITHYTCSICSEEKTEVTGEALGHAWGAYVETTAPGCTTAGEETANCTRCEATDTREIPALGHKDENSDNICDTCGEEIGDTPATTKYAIAAVKDGVYYLMASAGTANRPGAKAVELVDGKVSATDAEGYSFTIDGDISGSFGIVCDNGKYLSWTSSTNFAYSDTADIKWTAEANGVCYNATRYIRLFTSTSGDLSFRPYAGAQSGTETTVLIPVG